MVSFIKKTGPAVGISLLAAGLLSACTTGQEKVSKLTAEAESGKVESMVELAEMYCGGVTIEQDDQICGMWMKRASERGHKRAQYMLGRMYELGLGMRPDPIQAYKWYTISGSHDYKMADSGAKRMLDVMTPKQQEEAKKQVAEFQKKEAAIHQ